MVRKGNRKRKPKGDSRAPAAALAAIGALALCAFGLWRCMDGGDEAGPETPRLRAAAVSAVDVGPGAEVDPTILGEANLLEQEKAPPAAEDAAAAVDPKAAQPSAGIDAAGTSAAAETIAAPAVSEAEFPLHAVAFHFHTQIFAEPKDGARVIAYARRGAQFRVGERVSTDGCKRGWHEIAGGGFVCDGQGINVAKQKVTFSPSPPEPDLTSPLPYSYKYAVGDETPEYWRIPTPEEVALAEKAFARLAEAPKPGPNGERHDAEALREVLARAAALSEAADAGPMEAPSRAPAAAPSAEADAGEDDDGLPAYVYQRMIKGFYVSTDDTVTENGVTYARTVRGRFVPDKNLAKAKASTFEGVLLSERRTLPFAFVVAGGSKTLTRKVSGALKEAGAVSRYDHFPVLEELTYKGQRYVRIGDEAFLPARSVAIARAAEPPADLLPDERWIDVNLAEQTLVAYEGATPVFATLISSGRPGHETPIGSFRIYGKHVAITMDDTAAGDEAYSIEDVPWTQYFREGYALHAAFWHDRFGRVRSHGCVNLSPSDARRLFFWTGPRVGASLHGTVATKANPGTRVVIHK
ncbi:MAG: L,D-transpeptidase [Proteobacteria bacterium]|jgi:hypothetical protein|nr:L,D-transpeptidase [Pseudomonadota bacterium]